MRPPHVPESLIRLSKANEESWLAIGKPKFMFPLNESSSFNYALPIVIFTFKGKLAERMTDNEGATRAYENALRHNPQSTEALERVAAIARQNEDLPKVKFLHSTFF